MLYASALTMPMNTPKISFVSRLIGLLSPPRCIVCGERLTIGENVLCTRCNLHLPRTNFASSPYDNDMTRMFWGRVHVEKCAALFFYSPHSDASRLVMQIKYFHHPETGRQLGCLAASELIPLNFFDGITAIMPLPLAHNRERHRGFNQSRSIAEGISDMTGLPVIDGAIHRARFTESQTHKSRTERNENVENAFSLADAARLEHHHLLLVDDVVTTGATATACIRAIEQANDVKVSIFSLGFTRS